MGVFKSIKNFFSTKDLEEKPQSSESLNSEVVKEHEEPKNSQVTQVNKPFVCAHPDCGGTIDPGERWSRAAGKYYHKQCLKAIKRLV